MSLTLVVLGCGAIAREHAATLTRLDRQVRLGFASRDPARGEAYRRQFRGVASYAGYEAALSDPRVDAVLVATPPAQHRSLALAALEAGKHVIVEKPAFLRAADVDLVERAARTASRQVLVAENYRYKPLTTALLDLVERGEIGRLRLVRLSALKLQQSTDWREDTGLAGAGALFEGGVHWINLLGTVGGDIQSVQGFRPAPASEPERTMLVVVRFASGAVGSLHHSWEVRARLKGLSWSQLVGDGGTIVFESNGLVIGTNGRRRRLIWPGFRDIRGFRAMWRDFLAALTTGSTPRMTLAAARRDLWVIEEAYRTAAGAR